MKRERWILATDAIGAIEREVWLPETPDEEPEALYQMMSVGCHDPDRQIIDDVEEMRGRIDAGLIEMGWPPSNVQLAIPKNGQPRIIQTHHDMCEGDAFARSWAWIEKNAKPLSEAYWLAKMAFSLIVIEQSLEKNDMMTVFRHAMKLGAYQTEIDVRKRAGRFAETGKRYFTKSEEGAAKRRGNYQPETKRIISEMASLIKKGNSISNAARIAAGRGFGRSGGANRAIWYRRNKPVTRP